jgi:hypothetical protein
MSGIVAGSAEPLDDASLNAAVDRLGVSLPAFWAVVHVETTGCGYLVDKRPKILFERHYFSRLTGRRFDDAYPDISNPSPGGYGAGGANQYLRLEKAMALAHDKALMSTSWGIGQIMGAHAVDIGFVDVADMIAAMCDSEGRQIEAMAAFIDTNNLASALRGQNWQSFAAGYNGPSYAQNRYDTQLAAACQGFSIGGLPSLRTRTGQMWLTFLGYDPQGVDGLMGRLTRSAMNEFQFRSNIPQTVDFDDPTLAKLKDAVTGRRQEP